MDELLFLLKNFFTHKDFLPPASELAGTIFTPLHWVCTTVVLACVIALAVFVAKKSEKTVKRVFTVLWIVLIVLEPLKILWESVSGKQVGFEAGGILPLYPCSVFMFALPFAIFGGRRAKLAACGYICTIGLLGAAINFFYPINILNNYSCISFAGFHTFFYHGSMLFTYLVLLISGYHRYSHAECVGDLLLPSLPLLILSIPANIVNYSPIGSDYMFFKCNSFFLPSLFGGMPDWLTTVLAYLLYTILPALFYLPSFLRRKGKVQS